jgi:hypothetical protein
MASVFEFLILLAAGQQSETNDVARKQATWKRITAASGWNLFAVIPRVLRQKIDRNNETPTTSNKWFGRIVERTKQINNLFVQKVASYQLVGPFYRVCEIENVWLHNIREKGQEEVDSNGRFGPPVSGWCQRACFS